MIVSETSSTRSSNDTGNLQVPNPIQGEEDLARETMAMAKI